MIIRCIGDKLEQLFFIINLHFHSATNFASCFEYRTVSFAKAMADKARLHDNIQARMVEW